LIWPSAKRARIRAPEKLVKANRGAGYRPIRRLDSPTRFHEEPIDDSTIYFSTVADDEMLSGSKKGRAKDM